MLWNIETAEVYRVLGLIPLLQLQIQSAVAMTQVTRCACLASKAFSPESAQPPVISQVRKAPGKPVGVVAVTILCVCLVLMNFLIGRGTIHLAECHI